ncbi:NodT family efflux transporter outer membrane factor (OMF) lipoprotein [Collimonas sp. PA-H2]|uniref:efflux transporter outer membrane subunit n=1 Tax=Collimonas sp. PA-H2 TaxID=1881062 RepID=UPI000BF2BCC4|nr:efflux transporter outer membrane subunit [Collimonas sp. PA-H2]PFH09991.1 NodT family efflux transporter outer membrane factor (OMF) lipoprotein [Collimonas sp. PA-H2]
MASKSVALISSRPGALLATAFSLALAACAAGPDYVKPAADMPPAFRHAAPATAASVPTPALEVWWTYFNDPVLTHIIERVLAQNLDLAAALARVEQARASARLSNAALLPIGSVNAQIAEQRQSLQSELGKLASPHPGYQRDATLYSGGVGASWEADLAGGLHRGQEADSAEAQAAEADHMGVRVTIAAEAADAYFRVRGAQTRMTLAEAELKADSDLLELVLLRLKEGMATEREQAQAEARLAQVKATLPPLRAEREVQLNRLDVLMGVPPGSYAAELVTPLTEASIPPLAVSLKPEQLLRRRPDVIAAERRLAASNARIGVAIAEYYPKFSLSALLGFESLSSATPSAASFQPLALVGLRWRLFDFGRVDAEVARAKGANAEALAHYRQAMLRATEDVENALVMQTELEAERQEVLREVAADVRARDSSEEAYKGGATGLAEVLEQDRQLLAARDQLARAHTGSSRAVVATFRALGGGW